MVGICPQQTYTARNTKRSSLGWKEIIPDGNLALQKEMGSIWRSK